VVRRRAARSKRFVAVRAGGEHRPGEVAEERGAGGGVEQEFAVLGPAVDDQRKDLGEQALAGARDLSVAGEHEDEGGDQRAAHELADLGDPGTHAIAGAVVEQAGVVPARAQQLDLGIVERVAVQIHRVSVHTLFVHSSGVLKRGDTGLAGPFAAGRACGDRLAVDVAGVAEGGRGRSTTAQVSGGPRLAHTGYDRRLGSGLLEADDRVLGDEVHPDRLAVVADRGVVYGSGGTDRRGRNGSE